MSCAINIEGLASKVAITKPTVVGAAVRVFLLGGSTLTEKERHQAAGSAFLMKHNGDEIMALVADLEARIVTQAEA